MNGASAGHSQPCPSKLPRLKHVVAVQCTPCCSAPHAAPLQGRSEEILGRWLRAHPGGRRAVVVATKVAGPGGMEWLRGGPAALDGGNITAAIDGSLARLGTDCIDLLQLHWPDRSGGG